MIFLTVGSNTPFDRLVRAIDEWCLENPDKEVIGQIGAPGRGGYRPRNFQVVTYLSSVECERMFRSAELVIAHAGMGSIISALSARTPIVIMPRRASLGETRNDHQVATADQFGDRPGVYVARDQSEIRDAVSQALKDAIRSSQPAISEFANSDLVESVRRFIRGAVRS